MKKIILLIALFAAAFPLFAQENIQEKAPVQTEEREYISFCFFPGMPDPANYVTCNGLKLGVPVSFGDKAVTNGIDASLLISLSNYVNGIQAAPIYSQTKVLKGLQASLLANICTDSVYGLQFSVFNYAKNHACQIGIVNIIENGTIPFMIICNFDF